MIRWSFLLAGALLSSAAAAQQPTPAPLPQAVKIPDSDQWLYGSAEGSVATLQAYKALTAYALAAARHRPRASVVLAPGSSPFGSAPLSFVRCGSKPLAVVFDADETLIWNIPPRRENLLNNGGAYDHKTWDAWERTGAGHAAPEPGVLQALRAIRAAGITPIVNTNRSAANAAGTEATLKAAGIGAFVHGKTLFLQGDDDEKGSKDGRRAGIAARYCVIAMAGDQLGDFSNEFNMPDVSQAQRRAAAASGAAAALWGRGWFLLPNPSYGPWQGKLKLDDVYGTDPWTPRSE